MSRVRIRQSQVVSTFGPVALLDLPDHAVLVAGLEHWRGETPPVHEPRLLASLRERYGLPALELRAPPVPEREDQIDVGLAAWQFPEWFVAQYERLTKEHGRSRPLVHRRSLVRGEYQSHDAKGKLRGWPVVPVRFVQGCPNGHISDIDWPRIVHGEGIACAGALWLDERGTTGDLTELWLHCDVCARAVSLVRLQSTDDEKSVLGDCRGERPWLGPAALDVKWWLAVENRGEGVFLALDAERVGAWLARRAVRERAAQFRMGLQGSEKRDLSEALVEGVYLPYVLLHSFAHLLLTAVSLECGYAAASIRERIYVARGSYGVLLYTGTPDAEGTLGGLVEIGRRIDRHVAAALDLGALCSNDPVCAQHRPDQFHEGRALHGAACHGCLLIAESSCERRNELLDRALVVPTVDTADLAFFGDG